MLGYLAIKFQHKHRNISWSHAHLNTRTSHPYLLHRRTFIATAHNHQQPSPHLPLLNPTFLFFPHYTSITTNPCSEHYHLTTTHPSPTAPHPTMTHTSPHGPPSILPPHPPLPSQPTPLHLTTMPELCCSPARSEVMAMLTSWSSTMSPWQGCKQDTPGLPRE